MIPIDEVVHFDVTTHHPSTGAVTDADATPTFDVFEEDTDTAILSAQNFTKRTALTGNYRGTFTASTANGFEAGKWYSVVASATVNSVAAKYVALSFRVAPAEASAGVPGVDVTNWKGAAAPAMTGDAFARLGAPAGASVSADVAAVKADSAAILVDTAELQGDWTDGGRLDLIIDAILADTAELQTDNVPGLIAALNDPTAAAIADAVWDEAQADHVAVGSFGETATEIAAILVDTAELQGDLTDGGRLDLILDAILADTAELQTDDYPTTLATLATSAALATAQADLDTLTGLDGVTLATLQPNYAPGTAAALATVDTVVDSILTGVQALNNLSAAQVNAEVVDALATDTYAESSGVPAATASLAAKIQWLATLARNKITQTATTQTLRNDADSADVATAAVSDDGSTATRAEWT